MTNLLMLGALAVLSAAWFFRWRRHSRRSAKVSGYIPPNTSFFGKAFHSYVTLAASFITVGPLKVVNPENLPSDKRVLLVANHQFLADASVLRRVSGRHFRALGDVAHFPGFFGLISSWLGVVTFSFKTKEDRAAGELAGVKVLAAKRSRFSIKWNSGLVTVLSLIFAGLCLIAIGHDEAVEAVGWLGAFAFISSRKGGDPCLGIAPQGALMPDNELKPEEFRVGCVRAAKAASAMCKEPVFIVPMAFHYLRDAKDAHWSQSIFNWTRSRFLGLRNPKHWDPIFKLDLETLGEEEKAAVEVERKTKWDAYKRSHVTLYGVVVAVGEPIDVSTLSDCPKEAIETIRLKMVDLLETAKRS